MDMFEWDVRDEFPEGHKPIIIQIKIDQNIPKVNDTPEYKWNWQKADWSKYSEAVERRLPKVFKDKSVKKLERIIRKAILKAAKKHIGKKKVTSHSKPWFTKEIKDAIKKRNKLRKDLGKNRKA